MPIRLDRNPIQPSSVPETGSQITGQQITPVGGAPFGQVLSQEGQQLQQLGSIALQLAQREHRKQDITDANDASIQFRSDINTIENNLYSLKEGAARGGSETANEKIQEVFDRISSEIENQEAQRMFQATGRADVVSSKIRTDSYTRTETDKHFVKSTGASVNQAIEGAISNPYDDNMTAIAELEITKASEGFGEMLGWTDDQKEEFEEKNSSTLYKGIIEQELTISASSAKDKYEELKDNILPSDRAGIEEKLKRYGTLQESQALADAIHDRANEENLSLPAELALIPKDDADVRKKTEEIIRQKTRDDEYAELQARDDAKSQTYKVIMNSDVDITGKRTAANSLQHGADRVNALSMIDTLQRQNLQLIKQEIARQSPVNTFNAKMAIDAGLIQNQDQLIDGYFNKITASDFNFLAGYINQGGRIGNLKPSTYNTAFKNIFGDIDKNKTAYLGAVQYIREQVEAGLEPTPDRINQWIITANTTGEEIEGFHFSDLSYAQAVAEGVDNIWLPKIEDFEDQIIIDAIKGYNSAHPLDTIKVNDFNKRLWKRTQILGLPTPDPSIEKLF